MKALSPTEQRRTAGLSEAQRWILSNTADGSRCLRSNSFQVHTSFMTGERWFAAPAAAHWACFKRGWLKNDRITDHGRAALTAATKEQSDG